MRRTLVTTLGCFVFALIASAGIAQAQDAAQVKKGQEVYTAQKCSVCHDLERVRARRRDKLGWEDLVDNMRSRGAEMTAEEREVIVDYLTAHYGIRD